MNEPQLTAQEVKKRTEEVVKRLQDAAFREGWAKGYEKGFIAGIEAMGASKPKVELTDAV